MMVLMPQETLIDFKGGGLMNPPRLRERLDIYLFSQ